MTARPCVRCGHIHFGEASEVCAHCWEDLGQRALWEDEEEKMDPPIDSQWDERDRA